MKHIELKEIGMMKRMGWSIKAYYIREKNGVPFLKYFSGLEEMMDFNQKLDGVRFDGYVNL